MLPLVFDLLPNFTLHVFATTRYHRGALIFTPGDIAHPLFVLSKFGHLWLLVRPEFPNTDEIVTATCNYSFGVFEIGSPTDSIDCI